MLSPAFPVDEASRLQQLRSLNVLDTAPEERFDRLTRLARRLFNVPMSLVTLVDQDRQWFKSSFGFAPTETPRSVSFCGHAILQDDIMMVADARDDERFHDNPAVAGDPGIRFYAGYPLTVTSGARLGTLCLLDTQPRTLDEEERDLLRDLGRMAEQELEAVQLASIDDLTRLSNRRGFESLARHALAACQRHGRPASFLFFDLNGFKAINDTHGHAEGDLALITFAQTLRGVFRESDVLGRLGGDEFVVLLTDATADSTREVLSRLQHDLTAANARAQRGYEIRYSVGLIEYDPARHGDVAALLAEADSAMYSDKLTHRVAPRA